MIWLVRSIQILLAVVAAYTIGCAKVRFEDKQDGATCLNFNQPCSQGGGRVNFSYLFEVPGKQVDILFVNDNSGSMSYEQKNMAQRFSAFVSSLDSQSLDYRIGMITTDVSSAGNPARAINLNGQLQDGNLIQFADGSQFLTPASSGKINLFAEAISRDETATCEQFLVQNPNVTQGSQTYLDSCPSPDERGIKALNLFLSKNPGGFIRPSVHLAVIFLSDEDERSSLYDKTSLFALDSTDLPNSVLSNIRQLYPDKSFGIHSFIVKPGQIKSGLAAADVDQQVSSLYVGGTSTNTAMSSFFETGDTSCLNTQNGQTPGVSGSYGYLYALLSRMTNGIEGSICSSDYGVQLQSIGSNIGQRSNDVTIACELPGDLVVRLNSEQGAELPYTLSGSTLHLPNTLEPGAKVFIKYSCSAF